MMRLVNIALIAMVVAVATWTYSVKHDAETRLTEIRSLEIGIENRKELIEVLNADWAFLTQPARMQALSERFEEALDLDVTASDQIATFDDLPGAVERGASDAIESIIAGEVIDPSSTASIEGETQ